MLFVVCLFCPKIIIFGTFSQEYHHSGITVAHGLDQYKAQHVVGPGLDPNCLQRLSADDTRRQRVKWLFKILMGQRILYKHPIAWYTQQKAYLGLTFVVFFSQSGKGPFQQYILNL